MPTLSSKAALLCRGWLPGGPTPTHRMSWPSTNSVRRTETGHCVPTKLADSEPSSQSQTSVTTRTTASSLPSLSHSFLHRAVQLGVLPSWWPGVLVRLPCLLTVPLTSPMLVSGDGCVFPLRTCVTLYVCVVHDAISFYCVNFMNRIFDIFVVFVTVLFCLCFPCSS